MMDLDAIKVGVTYRCSDGFSRKVIAIVERVVTFKFKSSREAEPSTLTLEHFAELAIEEC